jgi:lysozyme
MKKLLLFFCVMFCMDVSADIVRYMRFVERWEGRKNTAYVDADGYSIGVGHHFKDKSKFPTAISDEKINELLVKDIKQALADAKSIVRNFDNLPYDVKLIVVDMSFNLGKTGFSKFKKAIDACHNRDWKTMAKELENSKWYRQVKNRSKHHIASLNNLYKLEKQMASN